MRDNELNKENNEKKEKDLCDRVLSKIGQENICPSPKWQCWCQSHLVWVLWALSVTVGAVSVAVMFYVFNHARFAIYEATHDTPLSFFVEVLPYIWIASFALMSLLAYYNLRKTKRGYRYPLWQVILSSLIFSVVGGFFLNWIGLGFTIDTALGRGMPTYQSLEKMEMKMWQMPDDGRLVGSARGQLEGDMYYELVDVHENTWQVDVMELRERDINLLNSGKVVRILGTTTDEDMKVFHACGVFPWMFDKRHEVSEWQKERREFVAKMYDHMEAKDRLSALEDKAYENKVYERQFMMGKCADLATMKRMKF